MGAAVGTIGQHGKNNGEIIAENHPMGDDIGIKLVRVYERINNVELPLGLKDVIQSDINLVEKTSGRVSHAVREAVHHYYDKLTLKEITAEIARFDEAIVQIVKFNSRKKADTRPVVQSVHQGVVRRGRR